MSSLMIIVYSYNKFRNWSTVIYSVEYYWEEGVYLDFRENGTFRAKNTDIVSSSLSYGEYEKIDSFIILLDKVEFGMSKMSDTLIVRDEGIYFTLESPWREISEATLFYSRK